MDQWRDPHTMLKFEKCASIEARIDMGINDEIPGRGLQG